MFKAFRPSDPVRQRGFVVLDESAGVSGNTPSRGRVHEFSRAQSADRFIQFGVPQTATLGEVTRGLAQAPGATRIPPVIAQLVAEKLEAVGLRAEPEDAEHFLQAFLEDSPGGAVSALRKLALSECDVVPRFQRLLRQYGEKELWYSEKMTPLERAVRVATLLFSGDHGLRRVQTEMIRSDLQRDSDHLHSLRSGPEPLYSDVLVLGLGTHGSAVVDRLAQTNSKLSVLGVDQRAATTSGSLQGTTWFMNSPQGEDDGRPAGKGRGSRNPAGGPLRVSDLGGSAYPIPETVSDVNAVALYEAKRLGRIDLLFNTPIVRVDDRSKSTHPTKHTWPAPIRATYADGRVSFHQKMIAATGFGHTLKPLGGADSDGRFKEAHELSRNEAAAWREEVARSQVQGFDPPKPSIRVMTGEEAHALAATPGVDARANWRVGLPNAYADIRAGTVVGGFGDTARTVLELFFGLGPESSYDDSPAQTGRVANVVWVVGNRGPKDCLEFLVGREGLKRALSQEAYSEVKKLLGSKRFTDLFDQKPELLQELMSRLSPDDAKTLQGSISRYQRISALITNGSIRLVAERISDFESGPAAGSENTPIVLRTDQGQEIATSRYVDCRGTELQLGPLAPLAGDGTSGTQRVRDCLQLVPVRGVVPNGVVGRGIDSTRAIGKSFEGVEDTFLWAGPGSGGDLVSRERVSSRRKLVSLSLNMDGTLSLAERAAAIEPAPRDRLSEKHPRPRPVAGPSEFETNVVRNPSWARLTPIALTGDTRLAVKSALAALLGDFDFSDFRRGSPVDLTLRRTSSRHGMVAEYNLVSSTLDRATVKSIGAAIERNPWLLSTLLQMLQDTDTALSLTSVVDTARGNRSIEIPRTRLEQHDAPQKPTAVNEDGAARGGFVAGLLAMLGGKN